MIIQRTTLKGVTCWNMCINQNANNGLSNIQFQNCMCTIHGRSNGKVKKTFSFRLIDHQLLCIFFFTFQMKPFYRARDVPVSNTPSRLSSHNNKRCLNNKLDKQCIVTLNIVCEKYRVLGWFFIEVFFPLNICKSFETCSDNLNS